METLLESMEDKICSVEKEIQEKNSKDIEFINLNYKKVKDFLTSGYDRLIDFLAKNGLSEK